MKPSPEQLEHLLMLEERKQHWKQTFQNAIHDLMEYKKKVFPKCCKCWPLLVNIRTGVCSCCSQPAIEPDC